MNNSTPEVNVVRFMYFNYWRVGILLFGKLRRIGRYIDMIAILLSDKLGGDKPFAATIDITYECNFGCRICGVWKLKEHPVIDPEKFRESIAGSYYFSRVKIFSFGGGEPFLEVEVLKKCIEAVLHEATPLQIRIVTNGFFTERIKRFVRWYLENSDVPLVFKVSIDGVGETHDRLRGVEGAYSKAIKTVRMLSEISEITHRRRLFGRYPQIGTVIGFTDTSYNIRSLIGVYKLAERLGVGFFHKPYLVGGKFFNESGKAEEPAVPKKYYRFLIDFNMNFMMGSGKHGLNPVNFLNERIYSLFYKAFNGKLLTGRTDVKCRAAETSFYLLPNGDVTPCLMDNTVLGNIYGTKFDDIWRGKKRRSFVKRPKKCDCLTPCDTIPFITVHRFPFYVWV